jgi:hypothetical protein
MAIKEASPDERLYHLIPDPELYTNFAAPIEQAFLNWDEVVKPLLTEGIMIVEFKSETKPSVNEIVIEQADREAHSSAMLDDGYKGYFPGPRDPETKRSRSFCIWESPETAAASGRQPTHQAAMIVALTEGWYADFKVPRYRVESDGRLQQVFPKAA